MKYLLRFADFLVAPLALIAAPILWGIRRAGVDRLPLCRRALLAVGVFPIRRHYYEPLFDTEPLRTALVRDRRLPGIDLNISGQLALLSSFNFADELQALPLESDGTHSYFYHNPRFGPGDAELLYALIRHFRPRRIVEIGSGYSTLAARRALARNTELDRGYECEHICIEPYEEPWLEQCGAKIIRSRVETVDPAIFGQLGPGDILFIDSSHMIRPGGDVLKEFLEIVPGLAPGVLVHVHDIFTPRDYPPAWVCDEVRFWNEQYLLEAFLCHNASFEILCSLNHLKHHHPKEVGEAFPLLGREMWREPGSFWMRRK